MLEILGDVDFKGRLLMGKRNYFYVHNGGMFEMTERTQKAK
jgi:hypothetical protein